MQSPARKDASVSLPRIEVPTFRLIGRQLDQVRELIMDQLSAPANAAKIQPLLDYIGTHGGKMMRPGLVLLSGECCGKITEKHIHVAAIVEMIHNATLMHDDVIDDGKKRRGHPTVNSLWGNESSVLLGDFILSRAFKMCAELEPEVASLIAATAVRVCEGELRQVIQRNEMQLSELEYIETITEKSAAFFSGCCRLGAILVSASDTQVQSLARFGLNAGIAFQIIDDLLDITGDEKQMGKTVGNDVDRSKLTLAVIHLLRSVDETNRRKIESELKDGAGREKALMDMLTTYGSLEYAQSLAQQFVAKAISALDDLTESKGKLALIETARFMISREI